MWLVICKEEGMRGLRRRSGVRQRGGRDCIQAREPRQPDPSSPPTPSTTLASCWKTNRWIRCLSFLRRSVVEKDTQNLWLLTTRNQLLEDGWVALLPCPDHLFSVSCPMPVHLNTGCNPSLPGTLAVSVQNLPLVPDYTRP